MELGYCLSKKICPGRCPLGSSIAATGGRKKAIHLVRREFAANEYIALESEALSGLCIVISGVVKVADWTLDGEQIIRKFVFPGEFLKLNPWKDISSANVIALTEVKICQIDYQWSAQTVYSIPEVDRILLAAALRECRHAEKWQRALTSRKPVVRVACFMIDVAERSAPFRCGEEYVMDFPMGHSDIADFLGLKRETVCRSLVDLREAKHISFLNRHTCSIRNLDALQQIVEAGAGICMQHSLDYRKRCSGVGYRN